LPEESIRSVEELLFHGSQQASFPLGAFSDKEFPLAAQTDIDAGSIGPDLSERPLGLG
jgi:hypothetical protein